MLALETASMQLNPSAHFYYIKISCLCKNSVFLKIYINFDFLHVNNTYGFLNNSLGILYLI